MESVHLTVTEVIEESHDARSLVFAVADGMPFDYRPGQFVTLRVPDAHGAAVARCYSLASSPHTDPAPKVTVKRVDGGHGSNWLCDNVGAGDVIQALPPAGVFTPADLDVDLQLWAAGSGITPVISILKSVLSQGTGRVTLIYANRDERSVIFAAELRGLASRFPDRLTVVHWLESVQGLAREPQLVALACRFPCDEAYLCGPAPFMAAGQAALAQAGVPRDAVHTEVFRSLDGDPFAARVDVEPDEDATDLTVTLDGEVHRLRWPRAATLVDAMLSAGLDVPYSCREGQCGSCAATLIDGRVDMPATDILEPEDIADGTILGCQARPSAAEIRIEF